jgi:hypothetical protein
MVARLPEKEDSMDSILQYLKEQYLQNPSQRPARACPGLDEIVLNLLEMEILSRLG